MKQTNYPGELASIPALQEQVEWMSIPEVAEALECSAETIRLYVKELAPELLQGSGSRTKLDLVLVEKIVVKMGLVNNPNAIRLREHFRDIAVGRVNAEVIAQYRVQQEILELKKIIQQKDSLIEQQKERMDLLEYQTKFAQDMCDIYSRREHKRLMRLESKYRHGGIR